MGYFGKPLLLMFLGLPGSGKSYFAKAIADEMHAVRLNGDSMRLSIFGSREKIEELYNSKDRGILNSYVFNGLDYVADQILLRGGDVVYDAHHNKRSDRRQLEQLAAKHGAVPVLVWIKTPYEVALKRGQSREDAIDSRRLSEDKMREVMERHQRFTDEPDSTERVVTIDGELPFEDQFISFQKQMEAQNVGKV